MAGAAGGVVVEPVAVDAWSIGAAVLADAAPLALPGPVRDLLQGRVGAVDVVGDVAVVTKDEICFIVFFATSFANSAIKTPPAFLKNDFSHFDIDTMRMIALSTLCATDEPSLKIVSCKKNRLNENLSTFDLLFKFNNTTIYFLYYKSIHMLLVNSYLQSRTWHRCLVLRQTHPLSNR